MISSIPAVFWFNVIELFIESTSLAAFIFLLAMALSRITPQYRSQIFKTTFIGLLLFPVFHFFLPHWQYPLISLSGMSTQTSADNVPATISLDLLSGIADQNGVEMSSVPLHSGYVTKDKPFGALVEQILSLSASSFFVLTVGIVWIAGATFLLFFLFFSRLRARFLKLGAREICSDELHQLTRMVKDLLGITHPIRLLVSDQISMPMTWGIFHPIIYFPTSMMNWSYQRKKMVLLHEISHIRNGDNLYRLIGQFACCFYWFNPFVWQMYRSITSDQEKFCDESVIAAGIKPTDYAEQLVTMTRQLSTAPWATVATAGMSRSRLERRVIDVLSIHSIKKEIPMRTKVSLALVCTFCFVLIAIISPFVLAEEEGDQQVIEKKIEVIVDSDNPDGTIYAVTTDEDCEDLIINGTRTTELTQEEKDKIKKQIQAAMEGLKKADIDAEKIAADLENALEQLEGALPKLENITIDMVPGLDAQAKAICLKLDGTVLDDTILDQISKALEQVDFSLEKKEEILQKLQDLDIDSMVKCEKQLDDGDKKIVFLHKGKDGKVHADGPDCMGIEAGVPMEISVLINKTSSFTTHESKKLEKAANKVQKEMPAGVTAEFSLEKKEFSLKIVTEDGIELTDDEQKGIHQTVKDFVNRVKKVLPERTATVKIIEKSIRNNHDVTV